MRVLVSTCNRYDHLLPGFAWCFNKYWSDTQAVTVLGYRTPPPLPANFSFHQLAEVDNKPFTYHLRPFIVRLAETYFTFILEDHWLINYVDLYAVASLEAAVKNGAAKADLGILTRDFNLNTPGYHVTQKDPKDYRASLEPSIWSKAYMLPFLDPRGCNPWQFEAGWCAPNLFGRVIGCRHEVYPKTGVDGVYCKGREHVTNIRRIPYEDCVALKALGYTGIMEGRLSYENTVINVL